jgi:diguanylate cyclase (GGDEF)-like protein/PAS domain S-box-containing protein
MARFLATGHGPVLGRPVELAALRKDGAEVPVELTIWALDAAEGWRFNAFLRDVTERHQAQAALHASEQRFRQAFTHAPIGMALLSLPLPQPGRFLQVNQALCELTGQDEATLLASSLTQVTHPADQALCAQALAVLAAGDTDTLVVEQRLLGPDAREVPVRISSSALTDPNGRPAMAVAQIEDRTAARQAMLDPLTGLPNRLLVADRLGHALTRARRRRTHVAVLFMDLDDFKQVNDSLGHAAGDQLLVSVAHRLQRALRASDTAGRLGGDEFVVICEDLADPAEAARLASRIHHDLAAPIDLAGTELIVTASIGIALANPATDPDTAPERLLADADIAMYRAKSRGRASSELYDTQLRSAAATRLALEAELRHAVAAGQLRLHYQPIVELASGRIVGVEALLRWAHPARGLLSPAAFLEVAERTGLIVPMGIWALEQACQQTAAWHHDLPGQPLSVAINLSARQLDHTDLPGQVQRVLDLTGVDPASVCLELTESQLIDTVASPNDELDTLDALKRLGVTLSVDDFGTGYSCLAYLKHLPVDILKIDRCFVAGLGHDPGDAAIVQAILTLAHALGLTCVAEGVETPQQCTRLQQLGCQHSQGHHFLAPQPAEALTTLLAHPPDWHDRS